MRLPYIPRGDGEEEAMLRTAGVSTFSDLLKGVPEKFRLDGLLDLPEPRSEYEVSRHLEALAARNGVGGSHRVFLGAGCYDHLIPAAVDHLSFRSEFYTSYTPYQAEVGQGTLTVIFEFQTAMAELTGMDLANASMYDGATALAEAALLAASVTRRNHVVIAGPLHPHYLQVLLTYCHGQGIRVSVDPAPEGKVDGAAVRALLEDEPAALVAQTPNFFGIVEDQTDLFSLAREKGAISIAVFDPHALALFKTPGEMGADIAVGEGQALGTPVSYGGPALGLFAASQKYVRNIPGRLVGETVDRNGLRAYVMTLRTREQDIRRARATSNICTNQGLMALRATIYLSLLGPQGMREVAEHCLERSHFAAGKLAALEGFKLPFRGTTFQEFVLECPRPASEIIEGCLERNVVPGVDLGRYRPEWKNRLLVCCNEKHTAEDIGLLVETMGEVARG